MRAALGAEALIDGFDDLIEQVRCDPKDRHVLAAAVRGGADTIVTCNLKDFPDEAGAPYGIGICHPDSFLVQLPSEHTDTVVSSGWPCHPWCVWTASTSSAARQHAGETFISLPR